MSYETVLVGRTSGVGIVTLNRPKSLNAMSTQLSHELDEAVRELESDDEIKAIIMTGSGDRAFCAGADVFEMQELSPEELERARRPHFKDGWSRVTCRKPVIGAVNGLAYGGGALLAASLDFLVGCEKSVFQFSGVTVVRIAATWALPLVIPWPMAKELLYTGRIVSPEEAYRIGLLNHLVPSEKLMDKALELAEAIAANHPASVQGAKAVLFQNMPKSWEELRCTEREARERWNSPQSADDRFKDFLKRKAKGSKQPK